MKHYSAKKSPGFSVPAAEHSTITSWGKEHEAEAYANILEKYGGTVAIVADSWNVYDACRDIFGKTLHDIITDDPFQDGGYTAGFGQPERGHYTVP